MTDIKQAATELLAAIDAIHEHGKHGGHSSEHMAMVDSYAVAKYKLREALLREELGVK